jgi:hypothetical protein
MMHEGEALRQLRLMAGNAGESGLDIDPQALDALLDEVEPRTAGEMFDRKAFIKSLPPEWPMTFCEWIATLAERQISPLGAEAMVGKAWQATLPAL